MHKYAIQVTVADDRDGALSGSMLREANSWGKVDLAMEQMVFAEATLAVPLIAGYVYHKGSWKDQQPREFAKMLDDEARQPRAAAPIEPRLTPVIATV
jgi:deoxyhypusine synthase